MKNIKDIVKNNKMAHFIYYEKENLFYKTDCNFVFPVPVSDVGDGIFNQSERAMLLMRYIRKQLDKSEIEKAENGNGKVKFVKFNKNNLIYTYDGFEFPIDITESKIETIFANEDYNRLKETIKEYEKVIEKEKML